MGTFLKDIKSKYKELYKRVNNPFILRLGSKRFVLMNVENRVKRLKYHFNK